MDGMPPSIRDKRPMVIRRRKPHTFVQGIDGGTITPSLTLDVIGGIAISLNNVPAADLTAFTQLFDQWRIVEMQVNFIALNPSATESPLYTAIDLDSSAAVTLAQILGYETLEITQGQKSTSRTFTPGTLIAGATTSNLLNAPDGTWIDCATPAQAYFGLLYALPAQSAGSATPAFRITTKAVFQFRNLR